MIIAESTDQRELAHLHPLLDCTMTGPALADPRQRLDHAELRAAVGASAELLAEQGVRRGDVVAVVLPNRVELVVTMYGCWQLGATLTPVNPALTADEVEYQLLDSGARLAVVDDASRALVGQLPTLDAELMTRRSAPGPAAASVPEGTRVPEDTPAPPDASVRLAAHPDDLALLIYTSGTTGRPKGVRLDHANLAAMTEALCAHVGFSATDRALLVLPLFHANAIMVSVVAPLSRGGSSVLVPRFDPSTFWAAVQQERPSYFSAVPAIFMMLSALPEQVRPDVSSLRFAVCGAAPMPPAAIAAFEHRYAIPVVEGYGLSESTVALTVNPVHPQDGPRKAGTVGRPLPGVEVAIMNDAGTLLPAGADGEVVARGATIMRGYLNKPAETAAALRDGWLHTGDVGHLDADGYLVLVDRKKDLIIRGGENISPSEVEAALATHPQVLEVAVVGRPDARMGEEPVAFVVPRPGASPDAEALMAHVRPALARFKLPREIRFLAELPHNAVGKIVKAPLREQLSAESAALDQRAPAAESAPAAQRASASAVSTEQPSS